VAMDVRSGHDDHVSCVGRGDRRTGGRASRENEPGDKVERSDH
jgi:hypothetical protein